MASSCPFDPVGRWTCVQVTVAISHVPVLGTLETVTRAVSDLAISVDGAEGYAVEWRVRSLDVNSGTRLARTEIPDALVRHMNVVRRRLIWPVEGDASRVLLPRATDVTGARLANPLTDRLPSDPDDPRVFDQDRDGKPGVTVRVRGLARGEIHVVQRAWSVLTGTVDGRDRVVGTVAWDVEQSVLSATNPVLRNPPENRPHPDPARSMFTMERVG
ncbi:MAG: hypothetical protein EA398_14040 [Deltaproteobacteria bacterium]|nr:MAG: hypothetical protein EA398_14040 [Deltaproteobacteria bacterium]